MEGKDNPQSRPTYCIICSNCRTCIMMHYALSVGRCWYCRAPLKEEQFYDQGGGI